MVSPAATASENEKYGIPRFAFTEPSIGSSDYPARAARAEDALAELLGDEHEILVQLREAGDDGVLGRLVDRRRIVSALADAGGPAPARSESATARAPRGCR